MTATNRKPNIRRRRKPKKLAVIKRIRLTDEQWNEIARHSGLPSEALLEVSRVINYYRDAQTLADARRRPSDLRAEIDRLRENAESLKVSLAGIFYDVDLFSAVILSRRPATGWPPRTGPMAEGIVQQRIVSTLYELQRLSDWLVLARERIPRGKPGAKRQSSPAYVAAERLDWILAKFTGKNLVRSRKRGDTTGYVRAVLSVADPHIGNGTIAEAIKRQIKWRIFRGKIAPDKPVAISPRKFRDKPPSSRKTTNRGFRAK